MIPPLRNNFARLRFVTDENAQDLARTKSPNYIFVAANGKMTLVMNQYKNDQRKASLVQNPAVLLAATAASSTAGFCTSDALR